MKPAPLVSYSSSDDEDDGGDSAMKTTGESVASTLPSQHQPSVHTSLGIARRQPLSGDWLCYVFVPLRSGDKDDNLTRVFHKAVRRLHASQPLDESEQQALVAVEDPHISLTRPILLRKHECDRLVPCVREALQAFRRHPASTIIAASASSHRLTLAFSSFSALPSQDATRTFWAADVSQGWAELRRLTTCLDAALAKVYARPYFEQPHFHASFAHQPAALSASTTSTLATLNGELGARLRACDVVHVDSLGIAIGPEIQYVKL